MLVGEKRGTFLFQTSGNLCSGEGKVGIVRESNLAMSVDTLRYSSM